VLEEFFLWLRSAEVLSESSVAGVLEVGRSGRCACSGRSGLLLADRYMSSIKRLYCITTRASTPSTPCPQLMPELQSTQLTNIRGCYQKNLWRTVESMRPAFATVKERSSSRRGGWSVVISTKSLTSACKNWEYQLICVKNLEQCRSWKFICHTVNVMEVKLKHVLLK